MAQKDILVNLNLHKQEIKDFLFERVDISTLSGNTTIEKLGNYYAPISNGGMIVQIVEDNVSSFYRCNGVTWEKLQDVTDIKALADERVKADITDGDGIKTETTTEGKVKVSVNNGDGLTFDTTTGKEGQLKVNNGDGLAFDTTEGKKGQLKVNTGVGTKIDTEGKVATNIEGGNGIGISTDTTDKTKQIVTLKVLDKDALLSLNTDGKLQSTLKIEKGEPPEDAEDKENILECWYFYGRDTGTAIGYVPIYKDKSIIDIKAVREGTTYDDKGWHETETGEWCLGFAFIKDSKPTCELVPLSKLFTTVLLGKGLVRNSTTNKVDVYIDLDDEGFLSVSDNGLKTVGIKKAISDAVTESKEYTDTKTTTHTHNGIGSQRISYFDLTNQPSFNEARQYQTEVLTGKSGTIKAQIHQCGTKPIAVCKTDGKETWVSFDYATNGDITWSVTDAFTQTDNAVIIVTGCSENSSSSHDKQDLWFGYEIDETESNPRLAVTRIAGSEAYKKAVFGTNGLLDGNLFRYVSKSATDGSEIDITEDIKDYTKYSKYKYGGLNGEDGDRDIFAVPKSQLFFKVETEGTTVGSRILRKKISLYQLEGFQPYHVNHNVYIGLYEATRHKGADGTISGYNTAGDDTLCSRVIHPNNYADYQGGTETSTTSRSAKFQGQPSTYIQTSVFSNLAHNKNTSAITDGLYDEMDYMTWLMLYDLYICDFGTLNSQDGVNTARDGEGFRQGGLGDGATTIGSWDRNSDVCACGVATKTEGDGYIGSKCGQASFVAPYNNKAMVAAIFYGIENLFGNVWTMLQGLHLITTEESGSYGASCYICNDPEKFSVVANRENMTVAEQETAGYVYEGLLPNATSQFYKNAQFGVFGSLLPTTVGSGTGSGTYYCDYFYTTTRDVGVSRLVLFGGDAGSGAYAGFGYLDASSGWTYASTNYGSRLCFFKKIANE